jgi:hypothetical protein
LRPFDSSTAVKLADDGRYPSCLVGQIAPNHNGAPVCPISHSGSSGETTGNPISVKNGEKRAEETDITLQTAAGPLAFTRYYRQSKQDDARFQFMGLGWTHNHDITLTEGTSTVIVQIPNGGLVQFTETSPGSDMYQGDPGSVSQIEWDNTVIGTP